jgi:lipopolysaccharide export system permease protein
VIVDRYIVREVLLTLLAVTAILMLIVVSNRLTGYLTDAAEGALPGNVVFALLGLKAVGYLGLLLPLAFYLGIMLGLGRLYRDSEMAALAACGVGSARIYRALLLLAVPLVVLLSLLAFWLAPRAEALHTQIRDRALQTLDLSVLIAGRFRESSDGQRVIYVERLGDDRRSVKNVFVQSRDGELLGVVASEHAYQHTVAETGDRYIVLVDGYRYEGTPGQADFRVVEFERHGVRIQEATPAAAGNRLPERPTSQLLGSGRRADVAELQWRIAQPLALLLLMLLAVPLARATPREGRYGRVLFAVLVYIVYVNLMSVARIWLERGVTAPALGLWWVHALLLAFAVALLVRQAGVPWLRQLLRRRVPV